MKLSPKLKKRISERQINFVKGDFKMKIKNDFLPISAAGVLLLLASLAVFFLDFRSLVFAGEESPPVERFEIKERHKKILNSSDFNGKLTFYVSDIKFQKPVKILIFGTGPEKSRWSDRDGIRIDDLLKIAKDIILDLNVKQDSNNGFTFAGKKYILKVRTKKYMAGGDYMDVEIHRNLLTGTLSGRIIREDGSPLFKTEMHIEDKKIMTNESGGYTVELPTGTKKLTVKSGDKEYRSEDIMIYSPGTVQNWKIDKAGKLKPVR